MNPGAGLVMVMILLYSLMWAGDSPRKGWFWYQEEKKPKELKREAEKPKTLVKRKKKFEFPVRPDAPEPVREFLKNPNEKTAEDFLRWQYRYFKHLEKVGFTLQQAYLKKGANIYPVRGYPYTPLLAVEYQANKKHIYRRVFESLKSRIGLIYFFSANCKICSMEDPLLEKLFYDYGISIRAVSVDGTVKDYPFPVVVNPNLAKSMGVRVTPTVVLVIETPKEPVIEFVGVGFTPLDLLESRMITALVVNGVITGQELNPNWNMSMEVQR